MWRLSNGATSQHHDYGTHSCPPAHHLMNQSNRRCGEGSHHVVYILLASSQGEGVVLSPVRRRPRLRESLQARYPKRGR